MEELTSGQGGTWLMKKIAEASACPEWIFHSVRQLVEREQTIAAQDRLIEERFDIIQRMSGEIASRDQAIASQAELIEERFDIIQRMSGEIASRDGWIADLQSRLDESERARQEIPALQALLVTRESELAGLYADRFVRMVLFVRRRWIGLRRLLIR